MMKVIGLTGGSGAGKGYVCDIFASFGVSSLNTDRVSRTVCMPGTPCLEELKQRFGRRIIDCDGTLNRALLADIVFSEGHEFDLSDLNRITHRYILQYCRGWIKEQKKNNAAAVIIDAPQLYESGFDGECDVVIAVVASKEKRIERIIRRDGISHNNAVKRISAQHDNTFFLEHADYIIQNDDEDVLEQVKKILVDEGIIASG